jgi:hypothetical protein
VTGLLLFLALIGVSIRFLIRIIRAPPGGGGRASPKAAMAQALIGVLLGYVSVGFFISQGYSVFLYATVGMIAGFVKVCPPAPVRRAVPSAKSPRVARQAVAAPPAGVAQPVSGGQPSM